MSSAGHIAAIRSRYSSHARYDISVGAFSASPK